MNHRPALPSAAGDLHPLTLRFRDPALEAVYAQDQRERLRLQVPVAILLGMAGYLLFGLLDPWLAAEVADSVLWGMRLTVICAGFGVLFLCRVRPGWCDPALAALAFLAGLGAAWKAALVPLDHGQVFFAGLLLVLFWTYLLSGLSFAYAALTGLALVAAYNLAMLAHQAPPAWLLLSHNLLLACAHAIGASATYLLERQRRLMVQRTLALEAARRHHEQQALHDRLTGLPNRAYVRRRLEETLAQARRDGSLNAGLFVDIDRFKPINDTYGHEAGDRVLREIAARLRACLRRGDTVGRIGGDEFFIVARHLRAPEEAEVVARKVLTTLAQPIALFADDDGPTGTVSASIGICLFPRPGLDADAVIARADAAMYAAKRSSGDRYGLYADEAAQEP